MALNENTILEFNSDDLNKLRDAVARNPARVLLETKRYLTRAAAAYKRVILRDPWRIGAEGGGAPVQTGNLRDTHVTEIGTWEGRIYPTAPYARYVHGDDGRLRGVRGQQLRPWLDFAMNVADREVQGLEVELLDNVVSDLAS